MTEEEARQRREENAKRKAGAEQKERRVEEREGLFMSALLRREEGERRLATESQNSKKPLSSDGFTHHGKKRTTSHKARGGHAGHRRQTLQMAEKPEQRITHRPGQCEPCHGALDVVVGQVKERRHIHEMPVLYLVVTDHHVDVLTCPHCQHPNAGSVPEGVQALAVDVSQSHVVPRERIAKGCAELRSCQVSERAPAK
jgi:transposase